MRRDVKSRRSSNIVPSFFYHGFEIFGLFTPKVGCAGWLSLIVSRLWPHPELGQSGDPSLRCQVCEVAENLPGLAGVDDFFDGEGFRRAEGRAQFIEAVFDLLEFGFWVIRRLDLGAVGGLDAAGQGQRAPGARQPGVAHGEPAGRAVGAAGHTKGVSDDHRAPGHGGLAQGRHGADA